MSAFVVVGLDVQPSELRVDCSESPLGPRAFVRVGLDVQLVASDADPETLRALSAAFADLAVWREGVLAAGEQVAA